jgi:G3E family GTPase
LALKFENFFKRWLQIFYPCEISTSLEEKNRQLMKLSVNGGTDQLVDENDENKQFNTDGINEQGLQNGGGDHHHHHHHHHSHHHHQQSSVMFVDMNNTNDLEHTLMNAELNEDGTLIMRRKRRHNPDRDKYIQEPQYVTKRTSSGRLVKMKIQNDYDYTSDQEEGGKRRKSNIATKTKKFFFKFFIFFL